MKYLYFSYAEHIQSAHKIIKNYKTTQGKPSQTQKTKEQDFQEKI